MEMQLELLEANKNLLIEQIRAHPFLKRCREGSITLEELKIFLLQQGIYSRYFVRYLCAMMANLPSNNEVLELAENLMEELGLEPNSPTPHAVMYREMLENFGLSLENSEALPGTRHLVDTMFKNCRDLRASAGLGALCLGAEALVPDLYTDIVTGFRSCDITDKEMKFFLLHIECDDGHAETIRNIMVDIGCKDTSQLDVMLEAGRHLVEARLQFFDSIETAYRASLYAQTEAVPAS
ncbi:iron-containing redox enzyme family protein [Microbulbifer sp. OS29]|uniref:Iron-containing redox enzyme family protein n=1 Tax=Microbulbifer okhotskensis TaxID=2926617 RepID=A0A9X2EKX4_9GAMM|nr:iron-containing redox enzyme family protein [Microbulbifer okhotskensis]MCO1334127.1 iron-containing redox enzyme family protein [Microbulbifer okhotskensis]